MRWKCSSSVTRIFPGLSETEEFDHGPVSSLTTLYVVLMSFLLAAVWASSHRASTHLFLSSLHSSLIWPCLVVYNFHPVPVSTDYPGWLPASWFLFIFMSLLSALSLQESSDIHWSLRVPLLRPSTASAQSLTTVLKFSLLLSTLTSVYRASNLLDSSRRKVLDTSESIFLWQLDVVVWWHSLSSV